MAMPMAVAADLARAPIGPDDPATRIRIIIGRIKATVEVPPVHERAVIGMAIAAVAQAAVAITTAAVDMRGADAAAAIGEAAATEAAAVNRAAAEAATAVETSAAAAATAVATAHLDQIFTGVFRRRQRTRRSRR